MKSAPALLLAGALALSRPLRAEEADPIYPLWDRARTEARWRSPTSLEREALLQQVGRLAAAAPDCAPSALEAARLALRAVDMEVLELRAGGQAIWVLREAEERRGAGLYAIRCGPALPLVWQAPHSFYDERTGAIVRALFLEGGARAAMWNTVHRYKSSPEELPTDAIHPADVTREAGSLFQTVTLGLAQADPALRFVQVHGFDASFSGWDAILSTARPAQPPLALTQALGPLLGRVAAYGRDVRELGGTQNVQGRLLSSWPEQRFLHVELSAELRRRLAGEAELRRALAEQIAGVPWDR